MRYPVLIKFQTDGSIISPASRNNVVGFKPTWGLISNEGLVPLAQKQDSPGPVTRSVADVAYLLDVLVDGANSTPNDYASSFAGKDLSGLRIGIPSASFPSTDDVPLIEFRRALKILQDSGAEIIENADYTGLDQFKQLSRKEQLIVMGGYFKTDIQKYFSTLAANPANLTNLADIIEATKSDPREEYPERGIDLFELADSIDLDSPEYKQSLKKNAFFAGDGGIPGVLDFHNLDVIAAPAMYGPSVSFAARSGLPVVVVPMGKYPEQTEVKYSKNGPDNLVDIAPNIP